MKKTILVSVVTSVITVILTLVIFFLAFDDHCDEEYEDAHKYVFRSKECKGDGPGLAWFADHSKGCMGMSDDCRKFRSDFDKLLSDEERSTIAAVKENFEDFEKQMDAEDHEQLMKAHKADFEALETIASNHEAELDSILALCHKHCMEKCGENKKAECEKKCAGEKKAECMKKCEGYDKYDAECRKKCGGMEGMAEKKVEVVIIEEDMSEGEEAKQERKVMVYSGDHSNMCRVHFLLMDHE